MNIHDSFCASALFAMGTILTPLARGELVVSYNTNDEDPALRLEAGDWSDSAETPSIVTAHGGVTREGGSSTMLHGGWGTIIDLNRRIGFQVTAKPGTGCIFPSWRTSTVVAADRR